MGVIWKFNIFILPLYKHVSVYLAYMALYGGYMNLYMRHTIGLYKHTYEFTYLWDPSYSKKPRIFSRQELSTWHCEVFGGALHIAQKIFVCKEEYTNFVLWHLDLQCENYWISKVFMNRKIELNYLLVWKIHNFCIASPNTTKQSMCIPLCIEISICTKNATSHSTRKPLHSFYCE